MTAPRFAVTAACLLTTVSAFVACGDDEDLPPPSQATVSSSGSGGAGTTTTTSTGGGTPSPCLSPNEHADQFSINEQSLCLHAKYTADFVQGFTIVPTWGRHGGLLTVAQQGGAGDVVDVKRYTAPSGTSGALTESSSMAVTLGVATNPLFINQFAVDLPFANWTVVGWSEFGTTNGEAIFLDGDTVSTRYNASGFFAVGGFDDGSLAARILHTGLTPLDAPTAGDAAGLYAADFDTTPALSSTATVRTAGDATGPLTFDANGNAFAAFPDLGAANQEIRGFAAGSLSAASPASDGVLIAALSGSGTALAAIAPTASRPGYLLFQPFNGTTFTTLDPIVFRYTDTNGNLAVMGEPVEALEMNTEGTDVTLTTDDQGRIWVGIDTDTAESTFYVIGPAI